LPNATEYLSGSFFSIFRKTFEKQDETSRGKSLTDVFRKL